MFGYRSAHGEGVQMRRVRQEAAAEVAKLASAPPPFRYSFAASEDDEEAAAGDHSPRAMGTPAASLEDRRTAVSPFRSLPDLHPHEARDNGRVRLKQIPRIHDHTKP